MNTLRRVSFILCVMVSFANYADEQLVIKLARPDYPLVQKNEYIHDVLEKSFAVMKVDATLLYNVKPMNDKRIVEQLTHNKAVTLAWLSLPGEIPDSLVRTTTPLYKGLHGKRLLIIREGDEATFHKVNNLDTLKQLIGLQQQSWYDYTVMKNNGLTVNGDLDYLGMIKALETGLGDYFPRSVLAIESELVKLKQFHLIIEPSLMLQYPSNYYFYLSKENQHIADLLEQGMQKLQRSGELERIYLHYFGDVEKRLKLKQRLTITLEKTALQ
ncbi:MULTISPECIES: hypothetical protein [Pseudoalteromonas]|uniref:hypothetical protein n=1 Tax=Pseudoalteromonas TaxID=53246 RepID=UPI001E5F2CBD|nr:MULTISPECIES: hypothetical protein [Pseudoalteromonas]MCC9662050.1 hypothetical protein [Pseudoalteromonas sp. MB41]